MQIHKVKCQINNEGLVLETGRMAKQANGAVLATYQGSAVLATVCASDSPVEGLDYIPLSVEYNEKFYAAGKFPGGYFKREGRPSSKEILVCRLIDRPIRPLFYKKFAREIQVVPTTISTDQVNPPNVIGMIASYAAIFISDIPFGGPVAAVRVALVDGEYIVNPTFDQIAVSKLDIVVAGTEKGITMVEGGAGEASEAVMIEAIERAHITIKDLCRIQHELRELAGKPKIELPEDPEPISIRDELWQSCYPQLEQACFVKGKDLRSAAIKQVRKKALDARDLSDEEVSLVKALFEEMEYDIVRKSVLERGIRTDGRKPDEIRQITCEIDVLKRTHGSALVTRGETQALAVTTLGSVYDEKIVDDIDGDVRKRFILHYNFPPFSVGETGRLGTGRREIGHGQLAESALARVLPDKDEFPYTLRVVSEILESNGSSSMATVCAGTLSLMNAGVPIKKPVAGIAMGLIAEGDRAVVLSDILGEEDHLGDMDFKVTGTRYGITAFQMDIKIESVDSDLLRKALDQARDGRLHILSIMEQTIAAPSESISDYAPKVVTFRIDPEKIGAIIGPGGKTIKATSEKTHARISVEDDGSVTIYCREKEGAEEAHRIIQSIIEEPEIGRTYTGTVKRIMDFGAFIEFLPGKEGLCHISKLSREHVNAVEDVLKMGQEIQVKIIEVDRMGRINLSYIDAIDPGGAPQRGSPPSARRGSPGSRPPRRDSSRGPSHRDREGRPDRGRT